MKEKDKSVKKEKDTLHTGTLYYIKHKGKGILTERLEALGGEQVVIFKSSIHKDGAELYIERYIRRQKKKGNEYSREDFVIIKAELMGVEVK